MSTGLLSIVHYGGFLIAMGRMALMLPAIHRYHESGRLHWLLPIGLLTLVFACTYTPGTLITVFAAIFCAGFRLADHFAEEGRPEHRLGVTSRNVYLIGLLFVVGIAHLLAPAGGVMVLGNEAPGSLVYIDRPSACLRFSRRFFDIFNYGFMGWLWPQHMVSHGDPSFAALQAIRSGVSLALLILMGNGFRLALKSSPGQEPGESRMRRTTGVIGAAGIVNVLIFQLFVLFGRDF